MPKVTAPESIPKQNILKLNINSFRGIDLSNAPANVKEYRSPYCPNMIPDLAGNPVKRTGYHLVHNWGAAINGVFTLALPEGEKHLIHAGTTLYDQDTEAEVTTGLENRFSSAAQMDRRLWILDGSRLRVYGEFESGEEDEDGEPIMEFTVKNADEIATVPMIVIGRSPTGGGTSYNPVNLLTGKWTDSFLSTANSKEFQLSFSDLNNTTVTAQVLNSDGDWVDKAENTDFTVERTTGVVTFTTAPGAPPVEGADNVRITAERDNPNADRINKCDICILFGVSGASDRLFVSGNPDFPNYDWYSQQNDPTYFGDTWYSVLGQDGAKVLAYSIINDRLAVHKDRAENDRNVIMRDGTLVDNQAAFPVVYTLQGEGIVAKNSIAYLANEPLFLTRLGIFAITAQDITGERYAQNRSFYINKQLTTEPYLENAYGFTWKNLYLLAVNNKIYILDGSQKSYEAKEPYSNFQFECYLWLDIPARILWERDGALHFGTGDGKVYAFATNEQDPDSYMDEDKPITAWWEFPDFDGKEFYMNKTVRYIAFRLASAVSTGCQVWVLKEGEWILLANENTKARYWDYANLDYGKFTYSNDTTPRTIGRKIKIKKVDKVRFRLLNEEPREPFGLYEFSLEYGQSGKYKK